VENKMIKVINPITKRTYRGRAYRVFIKIEFENGRLSITGVGGPLPSGNCLGSAGQIIMDLRTEGHKDWKYMKGWTPAKMTKLLDIWDEWHLNDMKAGTPAQEAFIKEWKKTNKYDYTVACEALKEVGLYEDNGYKYGTGWLKVEVPQDVIDWLFNLPNSEVKPAWV
jgi:hypothetical protein